MSSDIRKPVMGFIKEPLSLGVQHSTAPKVTTTVAKESNTPPRSSSPVQKDTVDIKKR